MWGGNGHSIMEQASAHRGTKVRTIGNAGSCSPILSFKIPDDGAEWNRVPKTDP
jgi:hypothetical protein